MSKTRLFVVHGSHPCATVEKALELKAIPYSTVELLPASQPLVMRPLFGRRTVPGIRFADGMKVQGSTAILRELDRRVPDPPLYGRPEIEAAERWGEEVLQDIPRTLLWSAFAAHPAAMHAQQEGQRGPKLPLPVVLAAAKVILPIERRLNHVDDAAVRAALRALPGHLDHVDALIADGVIGGAAPNAADLQIAPTLRLLYSLDDLRPLFAGRPAAELAHRWFPPRPTVPAGGLPMDVVPAEASSPAAPASAV
jgi:glutathione S-transferase